VRAYSKNASRDAGLAIALGLAACSTGEPRRIFRTGTSSFLPFSVTGICGTVMILSGTWRGVYSVRSRARISPSMRSSSVTPSASCTNIGMKNFPPGRSRLTTIASWTSGMPSSTA
jgi:hypothetical protein